MTFQTGVSSDHPTIGASESSVGHTVPLPQPWSRRAHPLHRDGPQIRATGPVRSDYWTSLAWTSDRGRHHTSEAPHSQPRSAPGDRSRYYSERARRRVDRPAPSRARPGPCQPTVPATDSSTHPRRPGPTDATTNACGSGPAFLCEGPCPGLRPRLGPPSLEPRAGFGAVRHATPGRTESLGRLGGRPACERHRHREPHDQPEPDHGGPVDQRAGVGERRDTAVLVRLRRTSRRMPRAEPGVVQLQPIVDRIVQRAGHCHRFSGERVVPEQQRQRRRDRIERREQQQRE